MTAATAIAHHFHRWIFNFISKIPFKKVPKIWKTDKKKPIASANKTRKIVVMNKMRNCETNTFQVVKGVGLDKRCEYVYDEHKNEENYELKIKAIKWNMYVISHAQQHTAQKKERTQTKKDKNKENMNKKKRFQKRRTYSRQPKFAHNKKSETKHIYNNIQNVGWYSSWKLDMDGVWILNYNEWNTYHYYCYYYFVP